MLHHSLGGEVIFFFAALYCSLLELNALFVLLTWNYCLLALPRYKGGNKGIQFKAGAINCCKENNWGKTLFNELWPLLGLRAKLDLRLTKAIPCRARLTLVRKNRDETFSEYLILGVRKRVALVNWPQRKSHMTWRTIQISDIFDH